ncbi:hypothetical protein L1987_23559 [Smallanthus sonchifolius]|uniref:Uncharacterized protein n=1 Tax=Smallanthus sonchifolius TaxID=185202 RepID=A0ACB9IKL7_9ASTR|nr:hypothetical protein L1987_23559 [Smallanthus sonchifolius]
MQAGELIASLDLDDPSAIRKAKPFHGGFPVLGSPTAMSDKVHQKCAATLSAAWMILAGYDDNIDDVVQNLLHCLDSPELPFLQWQECFAVLANRLHKDLRNKLESKFKEYEGISTQQAIDFLAKVLRVILEADVIECLRLQCKKDLLRIVDIVLSHQHTDCAFKTEMQNGVPSFVCFRLEFWFEVAYLIIELALYVCINFVCTVLFHGDHEVDSGSSRCRPLDDSTNTPTLSDVVQLALQQHGTGSHLRPRSTSQKHLDASLLNLDLMEEISNDVSMDDSIVVSDDSFSDEDVTCFTKTVKARLGIRSKNKLILRLMEHLVYPNPAAYREKLIRFSTLNHTDYSELVLKASQLLEQTKLSELRSSIARSLSELEMFTEEALKETPHNIHGSSQNGLAGPTNHGNMMHIALAGINNQMSLLQDSGDEDLAQERFNRLAKILKGKELSSSLKTAGYEVISCIIQRDEDRGPMRHSFHWSENNQYYIEEPLLRHVEPLLSIYLELDKLKGYENIKYTPSRDRQWHMYTVEAKPLRVQRMFLRTLVRQPTKEWFSPSGYQGSEVAGPRSQLTLPYTSRSILRSLVTAMEELELHVHNATVKSDHAHLYLYVLKEQQIDDLVPFSKRVDVDSGTEEGEVEALLVKLAREIHSMVGIKMHRFGVFEMAFSGQANGAWRVVVMNAFEAALENIWSSKLPGVNQPSGKLVNVTELVFADPWGTPLVETNREPGQNNVGMVAWAMDLCTPEFPHGRTILVVANDVTFRNGSFGPIEDAFFEAVTELACTKKLPLIYLAANSGARIGAAEEVRSCFRIGLSDESNPDSGFQYLYLTPEDYNRIKSSVIAHEFSLESGETRWIIDTIVRKEDGLGVENLSGSGAIAGAYSKSYRETFTLTYVTGRTVGIGAYLARLGMRCIQRLDQPINLTGFSALNKLLGREVYSSQMQLGGPKITGTNGVVHLTVSDDLEGVLAILNWLSFVPPYVGGPLPVLVPVDPVDRPMEYIPENSCDPRAAICGTVDGNRTWLGGIFDRDSFVESLECWARTVVTGRAKLGGIPVGVIAVET